MKIKVILLVKVILFVFLLIFLASSFLTTVQAAQPPVGVMVYPEGNLPVPGVEGITVYPEGNLPVPGMVYPEGNLPVPGVEGIIVPEGTAEESRSYPPSQRVVVVPENVLDSIMRACASAGGFVEVEIAEEGGGGASLSSFKCRFIANEVRSK